MDVVVRLEDCNGMEWNGYAVEFELLSHDLRISFFVRGINHSSISISFHFVEWNLADEKLHNLCNNEITRGLTAVKNRRFVTIPFSATTLGVRIGSVAWNLAEAVRALTHTNAGLSSVRPVHGGLLRRERNQGGSGHQRSHCLHPIAGL
jgi:hypothetical protein